MRFDLTENNIIGKFKVKTFLKNLLFFCILLIEFEILAALYSNLSNYTKWLGILFSIDWQK
jgi:hypothetical protein